MDKIFQQHMEVLGVAPGDSIAVGVSGGGDSMALALLLKKFCQGRLLALTVDHGLRAESASEAQQVHQTLKAMGIEHRILTWQGDKPATHIQEKSRQARYALLQEACKREGIRYLAIAHNAEDRVETFWMRLSHGSGLDGLAGMAAKRNTGGIDLIRPLLSFTRAELRAYCRENGVTWIEDPSNTNEKYLRVKLRQFEDLLSTEGLTPARMAATLQKLEDARDALQFFADDVFAKTVTVHGEGYLSLDMRVLNNFPADIIRRVVEKCMSAFATGRYPTPYDALDGLCKDMTDRNFKGRTLGGCETFTSDGKVLFCREEAAVEGRKKATSDIVWDGRFAVSGLGPDIDIGPLTESGVASLRKTSSDLAVFEALPFKIKKTLPALWQGENLQAVPQVSWYSATAPEHLKQGKICFKIV